MDMRFEWLKDREAKNQFQFYWRAGKTNLADYFTKHHPPAHHRKIRAEFLTQVAVLQKLRNERERNITPGTIAVSSTNLQEKANLLMPKVLQGCVELCT